MGKSGSESEKPDGVEIAGTGEWLSKTEEIGQESERKRKNRDIRERGLYSNP